MKDYQVVKVQKDIYERSIKPLITLVFIKLGKFDRFFDHVTVQILDESIENSLEKILRIFNLKLYKAEEKIPFKISFHDFNKKPDCIFSLEMNIDFLFKDNAFYIVSDCSESLVLKKGYDEFISHEEIEKFTNCISNHLLIEMEKMMKS